jgi:ribosomal protein L11 methyltransferase
MPFLQIHVTVAGLDPESVEAACFACGALSVTFADAGDTPILEPQPGTTPLWPSTAISALYADGTDPADVLAALTDSLGRPVDLAAETLADRAWEREWLKDFRPMRFGQRLWICPGGQSPPAETSPEPTIVWLDPGLAFGTGTHATTALCLEFLDREPPVGQRILDVGCGSGILAVAALVLGAQAAHGVDIDPQALIASTDNATRNGVMDRLSLAAAESPWGDGYDIVLANILAEPLIELAPRIAAATRTGGAVVLAGLLNEQAESVAAAYRPYFAMDTARDRDGWTGLSGRRL